MSKIIKKESYQVIYCYRVKGHNKMLVLGH